MSSDPRPRRWQHAVPLRRRRQGRPRNDGRDEDLPPTTRVRAADIWREALAGVLQRPGRSVLTAVGTVLGVAVLIVVLGLTNSAAVQITSRFNPILAAEVSARSATIRDDHVPLPADAPARAMRINGVEHAGFGYALQDTSRVSTDPRREGSQTHVMAVSPDFMAIAQATTDSGVPMSPRLDASAERVAYLGPQLARSIGFGAWEPGASVWIDGTRFEVLGVLAGAKAHAELLSSVIIPVGTARQVYPEGRRHTDQTLWVSTRDGAAQVVASQLATAIKPDGPDSVTVAAPPDPLSLRNAVSSDLTGLMLLLAGVSLVVGMISIANTTFVAIIERTTEIGLRRAIGARPSHIVAQFLIESTLIGLLGGLVGASVGVITVVAVCVARQWTAVLDWRLAVGGPLIGALVGVLAGLIPAWRAGRIEPIEALRS
ncbi:ABC transporter permease [Acidipropionibacterium timonense]|uniref:ABC transporter permease n=1 Tax=Acidipropionibacterium timonense TaxID=2161818 RepID=UPI0010305AF6|nr:ABC transporter permease [Acidipropionibacterium timonense]